MHMRNIELARRPIIAYDIFDRPNWIIQVSKYIKLLGYE